MSFLLSQKCSLSTTKKSVQSSSANKTSPKISANLTTPSSSTVERSACRLTPSYLVDQTLISPTTDQSSDLLSPEKSSILLFAEKISPSIPPSSADQTSLSASDYKTSHFLSGDETSLQSDDQSSACQAADTSSTANRKNSSSTLPLDARSDSNVETMDDMQTCILGPSSTIPSGPSEFHGQGLQSVSGPCIDENSSSSFSQGDAQSSSASAVDSQTGSGTTAIRPLMSIEVKPPAIPSLMSIKTSPPPFWCDDYAFGPRYRYKHPMPRHGGASRARKNTTSTRGGIRQAKPIPALMSIETSPPVPYNGNRNNGMMPAPSGIPSLMSIQTRPPWGNRPPRGTRPSRGSKRPHARGWSRFTS